MFVWLIVISLDPKCEEAMERISKNARLFITAVIVSGVAGSCQKSDEEVLPLDDSPLINDGVAIRQKAGKPVRCRKHAEGVGQPPAVKWKNGV